MIAACLFHACKLQNEPRSPKEIADIYDLEIKHINKGCRKFLELIDIESLNTEFNSSKSYDFIDRFANKLNLTKEHIKIAKDISNNIHNLDISSTHEPPSVAAGCIFMVAIVYRLDITKKQISEIFRISDVTISKTYRRIYPFHNIIMNNKITELVTQKRNQLPVTKSNITQENLVVVRPNTSNLLTEEDIETETFIEDELLNTKSDCEETSDTESTICVDV